MTYSGPENSWGDHRQPPQPYRPDESRGFLAILLLLGVIAGVGLLGCAGGLFWLFGSYADNGADDGTVASVPLEVKLAEAAKAFNSGHVGVGQPELQEISLLFDAVAQAVQDQNNAAFRQLVDVDRFIQQVHRSGPARLTRFQALRLKAELSREIDPPAGWQRYDLVRVNPGDNPDDAVVYAYLWNEGDSISACFWITHGNDGWKLYDWEMLDYGNRSSYIDANMLAYRDDPRMVPTNQAYVQILSAEETTDDDTASAHLRRVDPAAVLPEFRNDILVRIGYCWAACGRPQDALSIFQQISPPTASPGGFYGQAWRRTAAQVRRSTADR